MNDQGSLTPNDLRNQVFKQKMRGYDPLEVTAVLEEVAARWEQLLNENLHLREKDSSREEQLKKYTNLEQTLRDTLMVARKAAEDEVETAKKKANLVVEQARLKAENIIKEAESRSEEFQRQVHQLRDIKNRLRAEMEALLHSYTEQLKRIDESRGTNPQRTNNTVKAGTSASPTREGISTLDLPDPMVISTHVGEQEGRSPSKSAVSKEERDETSDDFDAALSKIFGEEPADEKPVKNDPGSQHKPPPDD